MSSTGRPDAPRYATLRDYLRVVRRNRILIIVIAAAFAAAAFALTARQKADYQAQAQVIFEDTTQQLNLLGTQVYPQLDPSTRAQINAQSLTRPTVVQQVKSILHSPLSLSALAAPIGTFVNLSTNVVVISATSGNPVFAEQLANAFAQAARTVGQQQTRSQFAAMAKGVENQFTSLNAVSKDAFTRSVYANRIAELRFLAQTADPVQIVSPAAVPTTPLGPHKVRNTLLGLLLGLTIGLIAAFGRDALDRRLRGSVEIAEELGWPVLGHVRSKVFGVPVFGPANGKPVGEEADRESFRILRQNVRFLDVDHAPRSVLVTSALPEEGKSTVARALASASAASGTRTLLVECDLRRPSLSQSFGLPRSPGLTDFLTGDAKPADIVNVVELPLAEVPSMPTLNGSSPNGTAGAHADDERETRRLACITAGRPVPETTEVLGSARFMSFLTEVTAAYELVILDAGPVLSVADTSVLLPAAEATLICVRADRTTHDEAAALKQAVERVPHGPIGIVVTGVRAGSEHDLGYYSYAYAYEAHA